MLNWEQHFGYQLGPDSRNLDALDDGLDFDVLEGEGFVLEIFGAEVAWQEDPRWLLGLLSIAQSRCREHLALGQRLFVLLVLPKHSTLIGRVVDEVYAPPPLSRMLPPHGTADAWLNEPASGSQERQPLDEVAFIREAMYSDHD